MKLISLLVLLFFVTGYHGMAQNIKKIKPKEIDDILFNPGIGFTTFQQFNGDPKNAIHDCGDFYDEYPYDLLTDENNRLRNPNYPFTTIAYLRIYWIFIEPEQGKYRWDIIDRALEMAHERGQTLMLSLMPYGSNINRHDVPPWYREMVGDETNFKHNNPVNMWLVDPEDPRYLEHYGKLIRTFGERYDGHPALESVDMRIVGAWGEGGGTALLETETSMALMDLYLESFKKTPVKLLLTDKFSNSYSISKADVGYRADCLGDLGFWAKDQNGWTHMYDYYPRSIVENGLNDAWKKAPVSFEICGTFPSWKKAQGYTADDVKYIFDQALKWHVSSVNGKSSAVPEEYLPQFEEFMKKMGYRFVLRMLTLPDVVKPGQKVNLNSWWENKGVAPVYKDYKLAFRLQKDGYNRIFFTGADVKEWLPGDIIFDEAIFIPNDTPNGEYNIQIALLDEYTLEPKINLAIEGKMPDGWYQLGTVNVRR